VSKLTIQATWRRSWIYKPYCLTLANEMSDINIDTVRHVKHSRKSSQIPHPCLKVLFTDDCTVYSVSEMLCYVLRKICSLNTTHHIHCGPVWEQLIWLARIIFRHLLTPHLIEPYEKTAEVWLIPQLRQRTRGNCVAAALWGTCTFCPYCVWHFE
jgi:hypothetical protein